MPSLRNKQIRGDQYVTLVVQVPERLNEKQKELLREFDAATGDTLNQGGETSEPKKGKGKKKGFMDKLKDR